MSIVREGARIPDQGSARSAPRLATSSQLQSTQNADSVFVGSGTGKRDLVSAAPVAALSSSHRIRRRNRMITSCLECRRRKLKCDKSHPCTNCTKFVRNCVFLAPAVDSNSQLKLAEIKEKMGVLERDLEVDFANAKKQPELHQHETKSAMGEGDRSGRAQHRREGTNDLPGELPHDKSDDGGPEGGPEDEKNLEPTPLAVMDAAYDADADDDMLDLGVRMGKMRMTERLGGYFRPKLTEELSFTLSKAPSEARSAEGDRVPVPLRSYLSPAHSEEEKRRNVSFLEPGPTYIAPSSGFFFGNTRDRTSILSFLPSRVVGDRLLEQYHDAVHFIARVVHWPSFRALYNKFWKDITIGVEPPGPLQAIVFAIMFSAVVSMNEHDVIALSSLSKSDLTSRFQKATEVALGKANFLRTTKLETLQALVVYLIPMCRDELSRAHSVLFGAAVRLAECIGLHRDPQETYGLGPLESHVRRTLWCQLCLLDIRTTEAQGPRPLIRRDDFDCSFPLNVDDVDLISGSPKESRGWTDMTFSKIRFECNEMHRVIWVDRSRLEKKQVSLTHVLGKIESFRKAMEAKYHPILDENVPLQKGAKLLMNLLLLRMHIMVLHRYHNSVWVRIPDRLRQIILSTGTQQMESALRLETDPVLQTWAWYCGAYQQWHTAFLLLVEVFSFPMRQEADRIWHVLDYVFEPDTSLTREQKSRSILSGLRDRTGAYGEFRKIKAPVKMISRISPTSTRGADSGTARLPMNFNSDPTPPASQSIDSPPMIHPPLFGLAEYPTTTSVENSSLSRRSGNHSSHTQIHAQSQFNSPYAVTTSNTEMPHTTVSLGRMTKALADAPSPVSPPGPFRDPSWTFDAPFTFFQSQSQSQVNKSWNSQLAGKQTTQSPLALSDATVNLGDYPSPAGIIMEQGPRPGSWRGDVGYPVPPPPGIGIAGTPSGLVSPVSSGDGVAQMQDGILSNSPQAAAVPETQADEMMMDIDWNEWDKIFPPDVNTGILNMPIPQQF